METTTSPPDQEAIDQFAAGFRGAFSHPGDSEYDRARLVRNGLIDRFPALIARCHGTADVVAAVNFAREQGLDLSVRGGSHNVAGLATSDGGIVIDLSAVRAVLAASPGHGTPGPPCVGSAPAACIRISVRSRTSWPARPSAPTTTGWSSSKPNTIPVTSFTST